VPASAPPAAARTRRGVHGGDRRPAPALHPYHLAHGLLDHAQHLLRTGGAEGTAAATGEARAIAERLGCQPLLDRADAIQPASPRAAVS
jgi:hypothetical protein